jgi:hypothetical protein
VVIEVRHLAPTAHSSGAGDPFPNRPILYANWARKSARPSSRRHQSPQIAGKALCRTRTDDPFLTMEVLYQLS